MLLMMMTKSPISSTRPRGNTKSNHSYQSIDVDEPEEDKTEPADLIGRRRRNKGTITGTLLLVVVGLVVVLVATAAFLLDVPAPLRMPVFGRNAVTIPIIMMMMALSADF